MRKLWLLVWGSSALVLAVLAIWQFLPEEAIGPSNYRRIRLGMTEAEVAEIIGLPAGDYQTSERIGGILSPGQYASSLAEEGLPEEALPDVRLGFPGKTVGGEIVTLQQWRGEHYWIRVAFDTRGVAIGRYLYKVAW
jgi:hypothetical protein